MNEQKRAYAIGIKKYNDCDDDNFLYCHNTSLRYIIGCRMNEVKDNCEEG